MYVGCSQLWIQWCGLLSATAEAKPVVTRLLELSKALGGPPNYKLARHVKLARRRFLFGLLTSVVPISKLMTAELLGPEKAVIGMALLPGTRAVGTIIGPAIGGLLVQPAVLYPSTFSPTGVFGRYVEEGKRTSRNPQLTFQSGRL